MSIRERTESTIPARFRKVVDWCPENLAVAGPAPLTYRELAGWASSIAATVREADPPPGLPVATLLGNDSLAIATLLGVLEAGRFTVALHPTLPTPTLVDVTQRSGAILLLTHSAGEARAREILGAAGRVVVLPDQPPGGPLGPLPETLPHHPAAVLHTSGSTGGVKLTLRLHRDVLYRVALYTDTLKLRETDQFSLLFHPAYAAAESDLFCSLLTGASVRPLDLAGQSVSSLWAQLATVRILHPSVHLLRQLLAEIPGPWRRPKLRVVALSGSKVAREDVRELLLRIHGDCVVHHRFSSTERGPITSAIVRRRPSPFHERLSIGAGGPGRTLDLVDEAGARVPAGEVGEFTVEGDYFLAGYWEGSESPPSPTWPQPTSQVVRTGDLGVRRESGEYEYVGRKDSMVKVLGYRVELGSVEAAILSCAGVRDCLVLHDERSGSLTAHCEAEQTLSETGLRRHLRGVLPAWQIPRVLSLSPSLPRTVTGKIDQRALRESAPETSPPPPPPDGPEGEDDLSAIRRNWGHLLERGVEATDDFFDLGGNSLLATRAMAFAERLTGRSLRQKCLLDHPTPEAFAAAIRLDADPAGTRYLVPLRRPASSTDRPVYLVPAWFGNVFDLYGLARHLLPGFAAYGLSGEALLAAPAFPCVEEIARAYAQEVSRHQPTGEVVVAGYSLGGMIAFAMAHQLRALGREVRLVILDTRPHNLAWHVELRVLKRFIVGEVKWYAKQLFVRSRRKQALASAASLTEHLSEGMVGREDDGTAWAMGGVGPFRVAVRNYAPRPYPGPADVILATSHYDLDLRPAWRHLIGGKLRLHRVPGEHDTILTAESAALYEVFNRVLSS